MWKFKRKSKLDEVTDLLLDRMKTDLELSQDLNPKQIEEVERLSKLKQFDKESKVSADTIAVVVGMLAMVLIVVMYEQKHVLTSRALPFIQRNPNNP